VKLPLMISDSSGNILYSDRSITVSSALRLFASSAAKSNKNGILYWQGKAVYTKEVVLCGEKFRFFMDSERICECLGIEASMLGNDLFDLPKTFKNRITVPLKSLVLLFADAFSKELYDAGIRLSVRGILSEQTVNVSPSAFAMCLALMTRLCANNASAVTLTFANECGRISIYADSTGGAPIETKAKEVLQMLLYEIGAQAGFAVDKTVRAGKASFTLSLEPLDISLIGLKVPSLDRYAKIFELYIKFFL